MNDLAGFLLARITEDRVMATLRTWHEQDCSTVPGWDGYSYPCDCGVPERMAAEADAKRRIVEDFSRVLSNEEDVALAVFHHPRRYDNRIAAWGPYPVAVHILELLALPYADHPDYREEWRP